MKAEAERFEKYAKHAATGDDYTHTAFASTLQVVQKTDEVNDQNEMTTNISKLQAEKSETIELIKVLKLNYYIRSRNLPMTKFTQLFELKVNSKLPKEMVEMRLMPKEENGLLANTNMMPPTDNVELLDSKKKQNN